MKLKNNDTTLQEAISNLADLFEYGNLLADTSPVDFINIVRDEIVHLREENDELNITLAKVEIESNNQILDLKKV